MRPDSFVGRERELSMLAGALDQVRLGRGQLALIGGEAGIGKTRLADQFAARAGLRVAWAQCVEPEGAPPYWPWVQVQRALGVRVLGAADSDAERFQLFDTMTREIIRAAAPDGLLLVLDDLHQADRPSLLLLQLLASQMAASTVMVVATYREAEMEAAPLAAVLAELRRERVVMPIVLHGLGAKEVADLCAVSSSAPPSGDLVRRVVARTEGNPFFIGELLRLFEETGRLDRLPQGIRQVLEKRLDKFSAECNRLLEFASAIGDEFEVGLLSAAVEQAEAGVAAQLEDAVSATVLRGLPERTGRYRFSHALVRETLYARLGVPGVISIHGAIARALEARDPRAHPAELARHLFAAGSGADPARALHYASLAANQAMGQLAYEEAARQYELALQTLDVIGGDDRRRLDLLLRKAEAEFRCGETQRSIETAELAAALADALDEPAAIAHAGLISEGLSLAASFGQDEPIARLCSWALDRLPPDASPLRARLLAHLAVATHYVDAAQSLALARQAVQMAERLNDPDATTAALNAEQCAPASGLAPEARLATGARLLQLGDRSGDRNPVLWGHYWRSLGWFELGDMAALDNELQGYGRMAEAAHDATSIWRWWTLRAARAFLAGRFEEAGGLGARAAAIGRAAQNPGVGIISSALDTALRRMCGGLEEAEPAVRRIAEGMAVEALDVRESASNRAQRQVFGAMQTVVLAELDRRVEAHDAFARLAAEGFDRIPQCVPWLPGMSFLAETCAYLQDREQAPMLYRLLLPYASHNLMAATITAAAWGSAHRHLGLLAATMGRWDAAVEHFGAALEMNRRMGAQPSVAQTLQGWAEALLRRGAPRDRDRAASHLREAGAIASRLGMVPLAERVARTAAQLPVSARAGPLTRRETEVAALVARGLTNRQIGRELHISERTVETHIEHTLNKLGFDSRSQVAAWVGERGTIAFAP